MKWSTVILRSEVKKELEELKTVLGMRSLNDVVSMLMEHYRTSRKQVIKAIMCNDLSQASASYQGWVRILARKGLNADDIAEALGYLMGNPEDMRVDKSRCKIEE